MTRLLSRYAEAIFWLARYVERAENMARVLDVQETFARDSRGTHDWRAILALYADEPRFLERYPEATSANVIYFYALDLGNPSSILSSLAFARDNARTLRPLISTEMWVQLNMFHQRVATLGRSELAEERLSRICFMIKEGCETHAGITDGTSYRDESWHFYRLGAAIERADQTTRLLDVRYYNLMTQAVAPVDVSQWNAVLRSVAGYHAYRRHRPRGIKPQRVAAFLLADRRFPRSVVHNLGEVDDHLNHLRRLYRLRGALKPLEQVDGLRDDLEAHSVETAVETGALHDLNDFIQASLIELSQEIGYAFFGHERPGQSQVQAQVG